MSDPLFLAPASRGFHLACVVVFVKMLVMNRRSACWGPAVILALAYKNAGCFCVKVGLVNKTLVFHEHAYCCTAHVAATA